VRAAPLFPATLARDAVRTRRLAFAGCALGAAAILWAHHPRATPEGPLLLLGAALACALLAIPVAFRAMERIWRTGERGLGRVLLGLVLAGGLLAYPAYLGTKALGQPITTAASTDAVAPPRLSRSTRALALRGTVGQVVPRPTLTDKPILLDLDPGDAQAAVLKALAGLRWRLVDEVAPGGRLGLGHVDAIAFSPVMHLPQDIAIRLTPQAGQTRVDVLSAARLGVYDFGESATTVRALAAALDALGDD
jgi:hypothetical protein